MSLQTNQELTSKSSSSQLRIFSSQGKVSYLKETLRNAGFFLNADKPQYTASQEQALIIRDLSSILESHTEYPNNTQEFISGLKILCEKETYFHKALSPTLASLQDGDENSDMKVSQDSLMRILLNVICLQESVIELLLEHATNQADNDNTLLLRLILNPLCYLSYVNDPKVLTTKLLDILEIAQFPVQLEILHMVPEIINDNACEDAAKQLSKFLGDNTDLTGAIIYCLSCLNLSPEIHDEVQQTILPKLETQDSSTTYPILFEFLLTDCNPKVLPEVLLNARNSLDKIMSQDTTDKDTDSKKALICNKIHALTTAKNLLYEGWINVITNIDSGKDHKPMDLLIMIMLHAVLNAETNSIEGLIRKKIKARIFQLATLELLFQKYFVSQILQDYLNSIIEIGISLLNFYTEPILIEYGTIMLNLLFNHSLVDQVQRQEIIYRLSVQVGMSDKTSVTPILEAIASISDFEKLQQHTMQLMGLFEKLGSINLQDAKLIFELLSNLTCGEHYLESTSGVKDEIYITIRKQLSSSNVHIKHRGIIGAVVMAKALVTTTEEQNESVSDSITLEDLPRGSIAEAGSLISMANSCTLGSPESVALYYDELASMLRISNDLNVYFLSWLYQQLTNDFQDIFITEFIPDPINGIQASMQFSLNTTDEVDTIISINLMPLTLKSQYFENNSILTLAPFFRLLRLSHYRQHNGDLSSIDALLGCAVIMPNLEDIEIYDGDQLEHVADCIFHCINWFREVISAFVTQKDPKLRTRVLSRVADIVYLEMALEKCLAKIPEHKLPSSYFDTVSQTTKQMSPEENKEPSNPKKKQKTTDGNINLDTSIAASFAPTQQTKSGAIDKKKKDYSFDYEYNFREIDTDILLLLRYPLKFRGNIDDPFSQASTQSTEIYLNINQFQFLMKDFIHKLNILIKRRDLALKHLNTVKLSDLVTDCTRLFSYMKQHLDFITNQLEELIKECDGCVDAMLMFTTDANELKITLGLIMKCFSLVFGWSGFQNPKNWQLLRDCLKTLQDEPQSQLISVKALSIEFTIRLLRYEEYCLYLPAAVGFIEIMQALNRANETQELTKHIGIVSQKMLSKTWYNLSGNKETGTNAFINLNILIKAYLTKTNTKNLHDLIDTLQSQAPGLKTKDDYLEMLPSIDKKSFHIFYRCLCMALLEAVKNEIISLTNNQHLQLWKTVGLAMQALMNIVKLQENKNNLISFLKNSVSVLKVFSDSGVPILEIMLRSKPDAVIEVFKIIQSSTRFLHHLCCYSIFQKDTRLVSFVPKFRQILETLVYRVKVALTANGCSEAFWMGTLKNKNMYGEEILSQNSRHDNETTDNANGNVLPADDDIEEIDEDDNSISSDIENRSSINY